MRHARPWVLVALLLVLICLGLAACGGYGSPGNGGGTPAPTTPSGY